MPARSRRLLTALLGLSCALTAAPPAPAVAGPLLMPVADGIRIERTACPDPEIRAAGLTACAVYAARTVYVPAAGDRFLLWHEIGHLTIGERLSRREEAALMRMPGMRAARGVWMAAPSVRSQGSELAADAFSHCVLGDRPSMMHQGGLWRQESAYRPVSDRIHGRVCRALAAGLATGSGA